MWAAAHVHRPTALGLHLLIKVVRCACASPCVAAKSVPCLSAEFPFKATAFQTFWTGILFLWQSKCVCAAQFTKWHTAQSYSPPSSLLFLLLNLCLWFQTPLQKMSLWWAKVFLGSSVNNVTFVVKGAVGILMNIKQEMSLPERYHSNSCHEILGYI